MLDAAMLLSLPAPNTRQESELLVIVRRDKVRSSIPVVGLEFRGSLPRPGFNQDDELAIGELQNELMVFSEIRLSLQPPLLKRGSNIVERVPARDVVRGDLLECHARRFEGTLVKLYPVLDR